MLPTLCPTNPQQRSTACAGTTIDFPDGRTTPGEYDLRPVVSRLPWPADMSGRRCIDIGSRDGFYASEMERRGAAEVVSVDISVPADIDFPISRADDALIQAELDDGHRAFDAVPNGPGPLEGSIRGPFKSPYRQVPRRLVLGRGAPHAWFLLAPPTS